MANFSVELSDKVEARFRAAFAGCNLGDVVTRILLHAIDCKQNAPQDEAEERRRREHIMSNIRGLP